MMAAKPIHQQLKTAQDASQPTAKVDATSDQSLMCDVEQCGMKPDLKITFVGQRTAPHFRCLRHWGTARSILTDAGYSIDYSPQALDWIMHR